MPRNQEASRVWFKRRSVFSVVGLLLPLIIVLSVIRFSSADTSTISNDWISGPAPAVTKGVDLAALPDIRNRDCTSATIQINGGFFAASSPFEDHCYVSTGAGLIEQEGAYIQPPGYSEAYTLKNTAQGGNPVLIPIPNQVGALWLNGFSGGPGVTLQYFKDIYNHISFDSFYGRFNISSGPDLTFRYPNGQATQFDYGSLAMDPNGRFMIADTIFHGIVRIDTLNLNMTPFADSFPNGDGVNATAVSGSGKFAALSHDAAGSGQGGYFKIVDIGSCTGSGYASDTSLTPDFRCPTSDIYSQLSQSISNLASISNVRFANERTVTFVAKYGDSITGYRYGRYSATAGGQPLSLIQYEAVGDSYISGEGAFNYRAGTNTTRNSCHQSLSSYPYLLSGRFNSFASVACSGAEMHNISSPQAGNQNEYQLEGDSMPTQSELSSALTARLPGVILQSDFIAQDNPEAITLSIGGNDIGFADIIEKCINPFQGSRFVVVGHVTCYDTYEDRLELVNAINDQFPKLRSLYENLKTSATGDRRLYVVGYPQVMKVGGDCGANVAMNAQEVLFAHDLIDYLDGVIKRAADEAGVGYVDTQHAFDGHMLCEGAGSRTAVNGLTFAQQPGTKTPDINGSFHPNAVGHELLAGVVGSQTQNMTRPMPLALPKTNQYGVDPNAAVLQNVPHSGRTVRRVNLHLDGLTSLIQKNTTISFTANARNFLTKAGSTFTFSYNNNVVSLGKYVSDAVGNITVSAQVPADIPTGYQTFHLQGNDVFGQPIDLQQVVFVAASNLDYDDDGITNDADSCPLIAQSGIDIDNDGVDDACDPSAVQPSTIITPEDQIIWSNNSVLNIDITAKKTQTTSQ